MIIILVILATLSGGGFLFMQQKQFGTDPKGARLERIQKSPNYKNGSFHNLTPTAVMTEGVSYTKLMREYFRKIEGKEPLKEIPSITTDLKKIQDTVPVIIWFGHSSYLIKINGKNILVDPVFSGNASPVSFFAGAYKGANTYRTADMPDLDAVIITHDHYDHLDYKTILELIPRTKHFYTSLGVGAHLEYWGVEPNRITEFDWWEKNQVDSNMTLTAAPARHFSGRKFTRGKTLWASYILQTPACKIFIGGDSGYEQHFRQIGEQFGPFDIAILECGQYNVYWQSIHMLPDEVIKASQDLKAKVLMPVHNSKFTLALHGWKVPLETLTNLADQEGVPVTTPMIGEPVLVGKDHPVQKWWTTVD